MTPQNPDSFVRRSPTRTEDSRAVAEVTLADVKTGTSNTPQSNIDKQTWDAMDALADEVALIFTNGQPFEILNAAEGKTIAMPGNATSAISADGHYVYFFSDANNLVAGDSGTAAAPIFAHAQ